MKPAEAEPDVSARARYAAIISERQQILQRQLVSFLSPNASFIWELGSGHGHFLTAYAQAHPDKLCVGVDIVGERIERALRKRDRARLSNLHFVQADARLFIETLPPGVTFSEVFVLFPDPWPKLRHHKHRIMQNGFLELVARRGEPGCRLCFRTDYEPYFLATQKLLASHSCWQLANDPWPFDFETVFQSRAAKYHSLVARRRA